MLLHFVNIFTNRLFKSLYVYALYTVDQPKTKQIKQQLQTPIYNHEMKQNKFN